MWINQRKRSLICIFAVSGILLLLGSINARAEKKLAVFVSIAPQKYFVEQIGGRYVDCTVLVQPGDNPHMFTPTPRQVETLISSHAYFLIGEEFEEIIITKLASEFPSLLIVNTIENIKLRTFKRIDHTHTDEHSIQDPHTWLNPLLVLSR